MTSVQSKRSANRRLVERKVLRSRLFATLVCSAAIFGCGDSEGPSEVTLRRETAPDRPGELGLRDLQGRTVNPFNENAASATVVIFTRDDCPISNRYAPEVRHIVDKFAPRGVAFWLVYPDPLTNAKRIREHMEEYGYSCRALMDADHRLVELTDAQVTPEAAVFNKDGRLVYCGRIDNRYVDFGRLRPEPTVRDLQEVLTTVLAGGEVARASAPAVGCPIADLK